jgi:hypothetical protein
MTRLIFAVAALIALVSFQFSQAAPINYGDFMGNTVTYVGVTEDSNSGDTPPLFGPPTVSGDSLDFNPVGFSASASGAGGNDVTDGNVSFMVVAKPGKAIWSLNLAEAGDTTLAGFGTDATFTSVTGTGVLNINAVDGIGIGALAIPFSMTFTPSGGTYGLASDFGGGPGGTIFWSGGKFLDINAILTANAIPFVAGATKISINVDNTLTALSQAGTFALMAKKDFGGLSVTVNVPEPATSLLASLVAFGLLGMRRRIAR